MQGRQFFVPDTVVQVLDRAVELHSEREALVTRSDRLNYLQLQARSDRTAHAFMDLGLKPGDRLASCLPNDTDVVAAFHGAMRMGAVWVGINRALAPPEKRYLLADSGASMLLCDQSTADGLGSIHGTRTVVIEGGPDAELWHSTLAGTPEGPCPYRVDPHAPAGIAYTSGTTGYPKGAVHSQHNLVLPGAALVASRGYGPSLRKGDCFALTILNMQVLTTLLVAQAGGCSVVMDRIDAAGVSQWIEAEKVTTWNGPPALMHSLAHDPDIRPDSLSSLDEVWVGGDHCPEEVRDAFQARFGLPVLATYGLTEAPTVVSIDPRDGAHVSGASGRPLPHLGLRILGDDGLDLGIGKVGEISLAPTDSGPWAGTYRPMLGYWGLPPVSDQGPDNGIRRTGDIGYIDGAGFVHVQGRKNIVIVRGGANVYPAEVERILLEVPGVAACAVVGLADQRLGQRVGAAVELAPGSTITVEEITAHCRVNLAKYKVPDRWVFVESLPRNSMGKIQRRSLDPLFD